MDRYDKSETHYNPFYGIPFQGESAGTSHFRVAPHNVGPLGYEYGFAGRYGSFTSADYYTASEEFAQSFSDTNQQPGNDEFAEDIDNSGKVLKTLLDSLSLHPPSLPTPPLPLSSMCIHTHCEGIIVITM